MTDEDRAALIREFEEIGVMTFRPGEDREMFDVIIDYIRGRSVPTYTDIDKTDGRVTISIRPLGPFEAG
jgi:hypothetical protein